LWKIHFGGSISRFDLEIPDLGIPEFVEKFQNFIFKKQLKNNSRIYMGVK